MSVIAIIKSWFIEQPSVKVPSINEGITPEGYFLPWTEKKIREDKIIKDKIRVLQRSGLALPYEIWDEFVVDTVVNFALWAQELPASVSYHHQGRKGLVYHSLDVAIYAMRIRRNYIIPPNTPPEDVIHREIIWVYGVFLAALFHDSGKIMDFNVELLTEETENNIWIPALGPIGKLTIPYRFKYKDDRAYLNHQQLGHTFLMRLLSEDPMLAISSDSLLFATLTQYLTGHKSADNVIEQIVRQADAASVAQDLGASKSGIDNAAKRVRFDYDSFAEQLNTSMSYLLTEKKLVLNKKEGEGFVDGEFIYLVCKPIAELIRVTLLDRGISGIPSSDTELFNKLQQYHIIRANEQGAPVWSVRVELTDVNWYQNLACLCIHLPSLVPGLSFTSMQGNVEVLSTEEVSVSPPNAPAIEPLVKVTIATTPQSSEEVLMSFMPGMDSTVSSPITLSDTETDTPLAESSTLIEPLPVCAPFSTLTDIELGQLFWQWIESGLINQTIEINTTDALLHIIKGQLFIVSPHALTVFCKEYDSSGPADNYLIVQDGFLFLGLHMKTSEGRNIHSVNVIQSDKQLNGFVVVLSEPLIALTLSDNETLSLEDGS